MSTRDEILAALTEHPQGLTYREIAKHCKACECDEQIVGRLLGAMRSEGVLHTNGFREGLQVYFFGTQPIAAHEVRETPVTLNTPTSAIHHQEGPMGTVRERIVEALRKHGPLDTRAMREKGGVRDANLASHCASLVHRKVIVKLGGGDKSTIYGLPGQKLNGSDSLARGAELGRKHPSEAPAGLTMHELLNRKAGEAPQPSPRDYSSLIEALEFERSVLKTKLEKVDLAIEAVRALA